jgi:hypothetical protein
MLEQLHCGIDVSKKIGDQTVLDGEQQKARRDFEDMAPAQRAKTRLPTISASISGRKKKGGRAQATTR